jgi:archaeosine-15-forming tRNA-guanine transglycosylase
MAKYETAWAAKINAKAYRDYLAKHPQQRAIPLTRAQLEAICRDLSDYSDLHADATAWAEQATRSAARIAELEAERERLQRIETAAQAVCAAFERLCVCHDEFDSYQLGKEACAEYEDQLDLRIMALDDALVVDKDDMHELRVARGMAIVRRVIAEQGGGA